LGLAQRHRPGGHKVVQLANFSESGTLRTSLVWKLSEQMTALVSPL